MRVFIAAMSRADLVFMYMPTLRTIHDGFAAASRRFGYDAVQAPVFMYTSDLRKNLTFASPACAHRHEQAQIRAGDIVVFVGVKTWLNSTLEPWQSLRAMGVYSIHVNLEPYENDDVCGRHGDIYGTDEQWEYSHRNLQVKTLLCSTPSYILAAP